MYGKTKLSAPAGLKWRLSSIPAGINIPVLSTDPTKVHLSHFLWHKGHFHPLPAPKKLQPCSSKSRLKRFHSPHLKCCIFNQKFLKLQGSIQLRMFLFISWITAGSRGGTKGHLFGKDGMGGQEERCRLPRIKLHGLGEVKGWIPLQKKVFRQDRDVWDRWEFLLVQSKEVS